EGTSTFGFQTARHVGAQIVTSLLTDAQTTTRWFFVVAMGRKAGHLALGMGKAAGATLTLIGEEYAGRPLKAATVVDALAGAVLKRAALGLPHGVAVLAEGLVELLDEAEIAAMGNVERDAHGHIRIAEIPFGDIVKAQVQRRLAEVGAAPVTIIAKNVGYELRCVDPVPFDAEYTRELGYAAASFLLGGGSGAMVTVQGGKLAPKAFDDILDPKTGRMRVRMVDAASDNLRVARAYMTRLLKSDLDDAATLAKLAALTNLSPEAFKAAFAHVAA
ncbi:MAG TPA: 6-phosphofructokinase, partial [Polyangiaceae bacterium]|nr:6-phosphofructokinase [Polyangiaceae bacterium]